jgi:hypothetical protein
MIDKARDAPRSGEHGYGSQVIGGQGYPRSPVGRGRRGGVVFMRTDCQLAGYTSLIGAYGVPDAILAWRVNLHPAVDC